MERIEIVEHNTLLSNEKENFNCPHKEIGVFILNDRKQILLQKRSSKKKAYPNTWTILTGHVEENESFQEAAQREVREEVGLITPLTDFQYFANRKLIMNQENSEVTSFFYIKCNLPEENFIIQKEELSSVKWYDIDDVVNMVKEHDEKLLYKENKIPLLEYLKNIGN